MFRFDRLPIFALFTSCFFLFSWLSYHQEVTGFESRFYLFIQEMWRNGLNWFPTTYGHVYPDYPVTATFFSYLFARSGLGLSHFSAALPSTLAAAATVVMCYFIGATQSKAWGFCAALLLLLTPTFLKSAYSIEIDMYPTLMTACCFYFLTQTDALYSAKSPWMYFFLFLGFMFRGPIGLIIPAGVISSYYLLDKQFKAFFIFCCVSTGVLILSMFVLLFMAYQAGGTEFVKDVLHMQIFSRMGVQRFSYHFYFLSSISDYAPIFLMALLTFVGLCYDRRVQSRALPHTDFLWKLIAWVCVVMIGMSIPGDKKIRYILPMAPALALLAAYPFVVIFTQRYFHYLRKVGTLLFSCFPLFLILLITIFSIIFHRNFFWGLSFFLLLLQFVNLILFIQAPSRFIVLIISITVVGFLTVYINLIHPFLSSLEGAQNFVQQIEEKRHQLGAQLGFYKERPDGLAIKYLIHADRLQSPLFIAEAAKLFDIKTPVILITSPSHFRALSTQIKDKTQVIAEGKLGHTKAIVFYMSKSSG